MRYVFAIATLFYVTQVWAATAVVSDVSVRATAPGQESAAMRFSITSKKEARLVAIASPVAGSVEIHSMTHDNGVMKMRAIEFLPLPAGKLVKLGASGNHVMLLNLKSPLKAGDSVPFTITIEFVDKHKEQINVSAEVMQLMGGEGHEHHAH